MLRFHHLQIGLGLASLGLFSCACSGSQPLSEPPADEHAMEPEPGPADIDVDLSQLAEPASCPLTPQLSQDQTARFQLPIVVELGGAPLVMGQEATSSQGGPYRITFYGLYLGNFELFDARGVAHPATLVDAQDVPLNYNVLLANADEPSSLQARLAVAPGIFKAVRFRVGVSQACNAPDIAGRSWPLTVETEMSWGWTMLNLRLEGFRATSSNGNFMYHVGLPGQYRAVQVPAIVDLTKGAANRTLVMSADYTLDGDGTLPAPEYLTDTALLDHLRLPQTFTLR